MVSSGRINFYFPNLLINQEICKFLCKIAYKTKTITSLLDIKIQVMLFVMQP